MSFVTSLRLIFKGKLLKHRLMFPVETEASEPRARKEVITFAPNETICFVKSTYSRKKFSATALYVVRTVSAGMEASKIEGVHPGARILLCARGETKVRRTYLLLKYLIESGVDLRQLSDSVFEAIHSRNEANMSLDFLAERIIEESKIR